MKHIVTLSEEMKPARIDNSRENLKYHTIGVEEFEAPSINQIEKFIEICSEAKKLKEVRIFLKI